MTFMKLRVPHWIACTLASAAYGFAMAESASETADEREEEIIDRIAAEQTVNGPHSPLLADLLMELGTLYVDAKLDGPALAAFERARGVIRANHGLSSLEEAAALEAVIQIQEAMGYIEQPWELEQELLALADAHPADLRAARIYHDMGDKRMEMLDRYLSGEFSPKLVLGCYYHGRAGGRAGVAHAPRNVNCAAGSRSRLIRSVAREARSYYSFAVNALLENELYESRELHELEKKIVEISYSHGAYDAGVQSSIRSHYYDVATRASPLARVESALEIADWGILKRNASGDSAAWRFALSVYEEAYQDLATELADRSSVDDVFSPEMPVVLPTFMPNPLESERTTATTGYIDVAFTITKYGRARRIQIMDATSAVSREAKRQLVRTLTRSVFRPRVADGGIIDADRVTIRYFVAERDDAD